MPPSGGWAGEGQNRRVRLDFGRPLVNGCGTQFSPAFRSNPGGRSGGILQASAVRLRSPRTVIARIAWNMSTTRGVAQLRWPLDRRRKRAAAAKKEGDEDNNARGPRELRLPSCVRVKHPRAEPGRGGDRNSSLGCCDQHKDPFPISLTGGEIPYSCHARSGPRAFKQGLAWGDHCGPEG